MQVILNNNTQKTLNVSSVSRNLETLDNDRILVLQLNFSGNYAETEITNLSYFFDKTITDIAILNSKDETLLHLSDINAAIDTFMETYEETGKTAWINIKNKVAE